MLKSILEIKLVKCNSCNYLPFIMFSKKYIFNTIPACCNEIKILLIGSSVYPPPQPRVLLTMFIQTQNLVLGINIYYLSIQKKGERNFLGILLNILEYLICKGYIIIKLPNTFSYELPYAFLTFMIFLDELC